MTFEEWFVKWDDEPVDIGSTKEAMKLAWDAGQNECMHEIAEQESF